MSETPKFLIASALAALASVTAPAHAEPELHWYKGNTHTHSLWSDGNDFPEMISDWYASHGYDFLAMSDHNVLARGEKWVAEDVIEKKRIALGKKVADKCRARFGKDWLQTRKDAEGNTEIRLHTLEEYRPLLEKPGKFLLVEAEEISNSLGKVPIHIGAVNVADAIPPTKKGASIREVIRRCLELTAAQAIQSGRPILVHVNHPNFRWALTAEDLAHVVEDRYFEVFNGHPSVYVEGDDARIGYEKIWDIANTIRLAELRAPILYGVATDDSHHYHGGNATPGRGFVMVHAARLEANALVEAMQRADFYASTGVTLDDIHFDASSNRLHVKIHSLPGVHYHTVFRGTLKSYDRTVTEVKSPEGDSNPVRLHYSDDVGRVLAESDSTEPEFQLTGDELFVRATITSDTPHPNPTLENQKEQAWIQPVGWEKWVKKG